jgi:hypothetical protein
MIIILQKGKSSQQPLEEDDGVVSTQSFQMLAQWVILGRIEFGEFAPEEAISRAIEFARLADMCGVTGMESLIAEPIKAIILAYSGPSVDDRLINWRARDTNTHYLTSQHIASVIMLHEEHPVRGVIAEVAVEGYLRQSSHKFQRATPEFSADLLRAVRATLDSVAYEGYLITFKELISGERVKLERCM